MKKMLCSLVVTLAATAASAQVDVSKYTTRGTGGDAFLFSYDECGYTDISLYATEYMARSGSTSEAVGWGWVWFSRYDWCTGESLWGSTYLDGSSVSAAGRGMSVQYDGVAYSDELVSCEWVEGGEGEGEGEGGEGEGEGEGEGGWGWYDCTWNVVEHPVHIDLAWTPNGEYSSRGMSLNHQQWNGGRAVYRSTGTQASADITGVLSIDGDNLLDDVDGAYGSVWSSTSGSVGIYRY